MANLLPQEVSDKIKEILTEMVNPITLVYFTDGKSPTVKETEQLLRETAQLSSKINVLVRDVNKDVEEAKKYAIQRVPSFVILDQNLAYKGVKFNGIPAGHEINSYLSALLEMSGASSPLEGDLAKRIQAIKKPIDIKVFVTLSCPHCPGAVQTAHRLAMENGNIKAEMIEAQSFPELSRKYHVSSVPKIVINDQFELLGNQPIEAFLSEIEKA